MGVSVLKVILLVDTLVEFCTTFVLKSEMNNVVIFHRLSNLYVCHHKMGSPKETPLIDVEIIDVAASEMSGAEYILTA